MLAGVATMVSAATLLAAGRLRLFGLDLDGYRVADGGEINAGGTGTGAVPATGGMGGTGNTDGQSASGGVSSCRSVSKPEPITVYVDASYTDTVYTYAPVALYVMQDRSSSMAGYLGTGDPNSWANGRGTAR